MWRFSGTCNKLKKKKRPQEAALQKLLIQCPGKSWRMPGITLRWVHIQHVIITYSAASQKSKDLCSDFNRALAAFGDLGSHSELPEKKKIDYINVHTTATKTCWGTIYIWQRKKKKGVGRGTILADTKLYLSPAALSPLTSTGKLLWTWTGFCFLLFSRFPCHIMGSNSN